MEAGVRPEWRHRDAKLDRSLPLDRTAADDLTFSEFRERIAISETVGEVEYVRNKYLHWLQGDPSSFDSAVQAYRLAKIDLLITAIESPNDLQQALSYLFEVFET